MESTDPVASAGRTGDAVKAHEEVAAAFAMAADFCLLLPSSRSFSYSFLSLTLGPGDFLAGMPVR